MERGGGGGVRGGGGSGSGHLQGGEGRVEQRRVKCCRTEDLKMIDSKSRKEHLASWVRRRARACVRWPRSHVIELREAKPLPSLLKLDTHRFITTSK